MTFNSKTSLNLPIYEQAADWLIEVREGEIDAPTRERLDAWFRASPEHIRAYLELSEIWEDGADPDVDHSHTTDDLVAKARSMSNVVSLNANATDALAESSTAAAASLAHSDLVQRRAGMATSETQVEPRGRQLAGDVSRDPLSRRRRWRPLWVAGAMMACVAGAAGLYFYNQRNLTLSTDTGEQRFVRLLDGSTLELNSRSRVRIRFSETERDVDLIEGQVLFHVAKDASRPFIVQSGPTLVRAVGTQFDVYRKQSGTVVTVVEGRVAVLSPILESAHESQGSAAAPPGPSMPESLSNATESPRSPTPRALNQKPDGAALGEIAASAGHAIYLSAGEQITVSSQAASRATRADTAAATAWTQHELVFDSTPLVDVAQDFNRYNTRQLIIRDEGLRDFHITGVFSSSDPASLLKFLRAQHDLIVEEMDDGIRISKK